MSLYKLHKYGRDIIYKAVEKTNSLNVEYVRSRSINHNSIAIDVSDGRNIDNSDHCYILSLPMSKDEKAKIYEIVDRDRYTIKKHGSNDCRFYPLSRMKLISEVTNFKVNEKLYNMNTSSYKK